MTYKERMSRETRKSPIAADPDAAAKVIRETPPAMHAVPVMNNVSGRVTHDDRGNAIWEWAVTSGPIPPNTRQRLKKLDNPTLSLADDAPSPVDVVRKNPLGTVKGYSPYDSGLLESRNKAPRKKDLRRLSEWLQLKKQAAARKPDDE
jgi:hypothetical protein